MRGSLPVVIALLFVSLQGQAWQGKSQSSRAVLPINYLLTDVRNSKHILVFKRQSAKRKYMGRLWQSHKSFDKLLRRVVKGHQKSVGTTATFDYEIAFVGDNQKHFGKYDTKRNILHFSAPSVDNVQASLALQPLQPLSDILDSIAPPVKVSSNERKKPKYMGHSSVIGLPRSLIEFVRQDAGLLVDDRTGARLPLLVLIGIPVAVARNDYLIPGDPEYQYSVYLIAVEEYLEDGSGLDSPVVVYNQYGGRLGGGMERSSNPLLELGERYLLFLMPARDEYVVYGGHRSRRYRKGEYVAVNPLSRLWLVDGLQTAPVDLGPAERYRFGDGSTLVYRREREVLREVRQAIKEAKEKYKGQGYRYP